MVTQLSPERNAGQGAATTVAGNPLLEVEKQGQAIWLDYIRRSLLTSGELKRLVDNDGLTGVTSNPTIFDKAIAGSSDYDEKLRDLLAKDPRSNAATLFEALAVEDIRMAADILRPVYDRTQGADGFVSLEVSPTLANDTPGTIRGAERLWKAVSRPNLMIKVPATPEGIPAIEHLIASGINVNITLMFSLGHYEKVANAYLRGLERCAQPSKVASVASFFVSRVDGLVDAALERIGTPEAVAQRGKIGIANCRVVYRRFREIFYGDAFAALRKKGARVQRVLWASTSTKNPAYRDVLYVEELIGPDTVNTMPPATLDAFRDHGKVRGATISESLDAAVKDLAALKKLGISLDEITEKLQVDGVASFTESFEKLMASLETKRRAILSKQVDTESEDLGSLNVSVQKRLAEWQAAGLGRRLWAKDPTLWAKPDTPEISDRLGWLRLPELMQEQVGNLVSFREQIKAEGFTHAVLLGMGGSSLAPEVFQTTFGNARGYPELRVLDSTHPAAVRGIESSIDPATSLFFVSSKSGTTLEPNSFFFYFWKVVSACSKTPGRQFVAITDPGTPLQKLAEQRRFRHVFQATPDVGGRYSALTAFGLVPAAVIGLDLNRFLDHAWSMQEACASCVPEPQNPGLILGAILGEAARAGRDKVTFLASPGVRSLPIWLEQLIAESTGKEGKGIVPIAGEEPFAAAGTYGNDRIFVQLKLATDSDGDSNDQLRALRAAGHPVVRIQLPELADLGQEFFRWEMAIAAAGAILGIHPFNQPDVQLAKDLARDAMKKQTAAGGASADTGPKPADASQKAELNATIQKWLGTARAGDYIGIDAYLAATPATSVALQRLRLALRDRTKLATMLGYGPRFLHSTGQLHKGGPNTGLFLQILDDPSPDAAVPETDYTFGQLIRAQAQGDFSALEQRSRRAIRVQLGRDVAGGLERLVEVVRG
ncbi:MAG: bifunctional transaldolase/phosoglucose isomerase [Candidatus Acidiferrales bacterium]